MKDEQQIKDEILKLKTEIKKISSGPIYNTTAHRLDNIEGQIVALTWVLSQQAGQARFICRQEGR